MIYSQGVDARSLPHQMMCGVQVRVVPSSWRIQKIRSVELTVYGVICGASSLQAANVFFHGSTLHGWIFSAWVVGMLIFMCALKKCAARPRMHDAIELLHWCFIFLALTALSVLSEDMIVRHRILTFNSVFPLLAPIILLMNLRTYLVYVTFGTILSIAAIFTISVVHDEEMPIRVYISAVMTSAVSLGICVLQNNLSWSLYCAENQLSVRKHALESLASMTFDATCWLENDKDTVMDCDHRFHGLMGADAKGTLFSTLVTSEEDRTRLRKALMQSHADDLGFVPATVLPITMTNGRGAPLNVNVFIVRYRAQTNDDSADSTSGDRRFFLGLRLMQGVSRSNESLQNNDAEMPGENPIDAEELRRAPLGECADEKFIAASQESALSANSGVAKDGASVLSLPRTTITGRILKSVNSSNQRSDLSASLSAMKQLMEREHWYIPPSHMKLCPDSILGKGVFGVVLKGLYWGAPVAVKLPLASAKNPDNLTLKQSANELRILRQARHPNLVQFFGAIVDEERKTFGLVLELVFGVMLSEFRFATYSNEAVQQRWQVITGIANALSYLHSHAPTIVHGDLKPSNVLVEERPPFTHAKLLDFGLSRLRTLGAEPIGGSVKWMAPEAWQDGCIHPKSDVFSFGYLVYHATTGRKPFEGASKTEVEGRLNEGLPSVLTWNSESALDKLSQEVAEKCFQPFERRPDMTTIISELIGWSERGLGESISYMCGLPTFGETVRSWADGLDMLKAAQDDVKGRSTSTPKQCSKVLANPLRKVTSVAAKEKSLQELLKHWNFESQPGSCCNYHGALEAAITVCSQMLDKQCSSDVVPLSGQCARCGWLFDDSTSASAASYATCQVCGPSLPTLSL